MQENKIVGNIVESPQKGERFFEKGFEKAHTVVFFIDEKGNRLGMLQRAATLDFAPNLYTGVGGKIEKEEDHFDGAVRELNEELHLEEEFKKETIKEFGRVIINGKAIICYFASSYKENVLPQTEENIGELKWTSFDDVMNLEIIPTTRYFMEEWKKRGWDTSKPFTVLFSREDANDIHSKLKSIEVEDGLVADPR